MALEIDDELQFRTDNVPAFVTEVQDYYMRTGGNATPRKIDPFLTFLERLTDEIPSVSEYGSWGSDTEDEYKAWKGRLSNYREEVTNAMAINPDNGTLIAETVTGPLIMGWYPGATQQKPLDAISPIQLSHMANVTRANMEKAWRDFGKDLEDATENAAEAAKKAAEDAKEKGKKWGEQGKTAEDAIFGPIKALGWVFDSDKPWRAPLIGVGIIGVAVGVVYGINRIGAVTVVNK